MPNKHARKNPNSIKSGICNSFTASDGLMQNTLADNALSALSHTKQGQAFRGGESYPIQQNERRVKTVYFKDENGELKQRRIYIKSEIEYTVRDFKTDKTIGIKFIDGEYMTSEQVEKKGLTISGLLQMAKIHG